MNTLHAMPLSALLFPLFALGAALASPAPRDDPWQPVHDAMAKGLPRTALEALAPIEAAALGRGAHAEAAKAIATRIALEGIIQGNQPEEKIRRIEPEIDRAPAAVQPLLRTIQAIWFRQYYEHNRWRFLQRTATGEAPGDDFTAWDLPRLFREIDSRFAGALAAADALRRTPVAALDDLVEKGSLPDAYRPTAYDFVAHEALRFYTSGEQAGARPQDAFEICAEDPIFDGSDAFMAWRPATGEPDAPALKAILLYQDLMRFHRGDADPSAFLDVDLARLVFGNGVATGEAKPERYRAALRRFIEERAAHEISALALHHLARALRDAGDPAEAHALARRGESAFPESAGGRLCHNLIDSIEERLLETRIESVWNTPRPTIAVRYRNLDTVHFRVVPVDWERWTLPQARSRSSENERDRRAALLAETPSASWSAPLPPTPDFKERTEQLPAPESLAPGFHVLIASARPGFGEQDNVVACAGFWVSDLALVTRPRAGQLEGFVLQAGSGEPIPGAAISSWSLDSTRGARPGPGTETDADGFFSLKTGAQAARHLVRARHGGDQVATGNEIGVWRRPQRKDAVYHAALFTDRALYRPGQTIRYKGVIVRIDAAGEKSEVAPERTVVVVLNDPNGKESARARAKTNDYGSFSGSFTAPRDRLTGRMTIRIVDGAGGGASFNVEEYKRPKFEVTLDAPATGARLAAKVSIRGKAQNYTGAPVDGAGVRWRVVREVRRPFWWDLFFGWRTPARRESQEIASGTTRTGADGAFNVAFTARPDPTVREEDEAWFHFTVHADVTDGAGETRSAQRAVRVGFVALDVGLETDEWLTDERPVELRARTSTLDGEPQPAKGTVTIHRLKQPERVPRPPLGSDRRYPRPEPGAPPDPGDPNHWDLGERIVELPFSTDASTGRQTLATRLGPGLYRAILRTKDRHGKIVTARAPLHVVRPDAPTLDAKIPQLLVARAWRVEPGDTFTALWGTGYDRGRAFVELERQGRILRRFWTDPGRTQQPIRAEVTESLRGGFTLHVTQVRENRAHLVSRAVDVPWTNKELKLRWEHFTSKLEPGQKESWTLVVSKPAARADPAGDAKAPAATAAELVATLYDESLDQFLPHNWPTHFGLLRRDWSDARPTFANTLEFLARFRGSWTSRRVPDSFSYRTLPQTIVGDFHGFGFPRHILGAVFTARGGAAKAAPRAPAMAAMDATGGALAQEALAVGGLAGEEARKAAADREDGGGAGAAPRSPDLTGVALRKNLNETAFFYPHLLADASGEVRIAFTMPEALTRWRFLAFAHDRAACAGRFEDHVVTSKDLMIQPNPPRFLREGDELEFTVRIINRTAQRQTGTARLHFEDACTGADADAALGNATPEIGFDVPGNQSRTQAWRIRVPDGCGFLTYKATGATAQVGDGEEGHLPVLARRVPVTESLPLPLRGPGAREFRFERLLASGASDTLRHQSVVAQMVSRPAWYAVMALPYLMEFPHECTEQTFNRLYANALARHIARSDPRIRSVFEQWRATAALESPLEKNAELKAVMLEETPWVRQAQGESAARRNVGVLFDDNRLEEETARVLAKLAEAQHADGAWPWFPGGRPDPYITLYIAAGFGRLRHLGASIDVAPALRALARLDRRLAERHREILRAPHPDRYVPAPEDAFHLYGRSFFLKDKPVAAGECAGAFEFFLRQARDRWLELGSRQSQGHLALALHRVGGAENAAAARDILRSIKERSVTDAELGRFWRETESGWWWHRAPIETQALMIEAFDEVAGDRDTVEECRVWLLKQKQTQDWRTTKATADAIYALLLRGADLLAPGPLVELSLGGRPVTPGARGAEGATPALEPGTGFFECRFGAGEITPALGTISVRKADPGVAWGSVHWQYLEEIGKITPYTGTPLTLRKTLHTKVNMPAGPTLEPVRGPVRVGDELVVRIELRTDRDIEYIHLKDGRGSGTEPVDVLSGHRYQDGLAYYQSTRDAATHFFIPSLPKGVHVFEYSTRVQHRGRYQTGVASVQCMYAPEFNSHSASVAIEVR